MFRPRRRIQRDARGNYVLRLPDEERSLLVALPAQLARLLEDVGPTTPTPDDLRRMFPSAYPTDDHAESSYREATRGALIDHHKHALEVLTQTAQMDRLDEAGAEAWLGALNSLRLVIGSRLDVTEEAHEIDPEEENYADWVCYHYLSYLEGELIEAMSEALPPPLPGAGDDLPEDPWGEPLGGLRWDGTPEPPVA